MYIMPCTFNLTSRNDINNPTLNKTKVQIPTYLLVTLSQSVTTLQMNETQSNIMHNPTDQNTAGHVEVQPCEKYWSYSERATGEIKGQA